ncbi:MAG: hypothetical protein WCE75_11785 [Terracidiphilus sp.]
MTPFDLEEERMILQRRCDGERTQLERNRLGQFSTPFELATEIVRESMRFFGPDEPIRFLDPAFGTGAFYSALLQEFGHRVEGAHGIEVDAHYGAPAQRLWSGSGLDLRIADFIATERKQIQASLLICNPPYVRHHHLNTGVKTGLRRTMNQLGFQVSGLAGLYCYFMLLSHECLAPDAVSAWLIPSEFMDVNYGDVLKQYLLERVCLLRVHRFDPNEVQFSDALVSSAVVWFRNTPPGAGGRVTFSYGGTIEEPAQQVQRPLSSLALEPKWTRLAEPSSPVHLPVAGMVLGDLFSIKRGIATGDNGFFIVSEQYAQERGFSRQFLRPILPSPRYLKADEIDADEDGTPKIEKRLFLVDCPVGEEELSRRDPALFRYLKEGESSVAGGYLCRSRDPWYSQESRPPAPYLCTYMGRPGTGNQKAFRFFHNRSSATAANVYLLLYPRSGLRTAIEVPGVAARVFDLLQDIPIQKMTGEGRVYGGGLHKLEPRELANVPMNGIGAVVPGLSPRPEQMRFAYLASGGPAPALAS